MPPDEPRTDDELVAAANAGDADAFNTLYLRYRDWTLRIAVRFTRDADEALDVLQDAWLYLLKKFPGFELTARLTTFLYPVVKHVALRRRERRGRFVAGAESLERLPDTRVLEVTAHHLRAELGTVLARLPGEQREVLLMRFVDDMSLAEIAAVLRIPLGTVKSRLHNAVATLRGEPRVRAYFEQE